MCWQVLLDALHCVILSDGSVGEQARQLALSPMLPDVLAAAGSVCSIQLPEGTPEALQTVAQY